ncbi:MAG: GNAT family N-acetyltransferase [Candidatus Dormibacteria bacterium]
MLRRASLRQPRARQLGAADSVAVGACLELHPLETVYLRSEIRHGALRQGAVVGVEHPGDRRLHAVALQGPLVVPWAPAERDLVTLAGALREQVHFMQLIVGPRDQVAGLQRLLAPHLPPVRLLRAEQPHYAVDLDGLVRVGAEPPRLRLATVADLEQAVAAGAAMHLEEVGFDPLRSDPVGFRQRVLTLIRRGWVHVWMEDGEIVFKAECSAVTAEAIQLQGVWTNPRFRGQGRGTLAMACLCQQLLADTAAVTLFVNDFNAVAIHVYERIGFRRIGTMRSVLF